MTRTLTTLAALLALTACSSDDSGGYNLDDVPADQRDLVERTIEAGNCEDLQVLFDGADFRGDADTMGVLDDAMEELGCYE